MGQKDVRPGRMSTVFRLSGQFSVRFPQTGRAKFRP
jgi:hypothetical protein